MGETTYRPGNLAAFCSALLLRPTIKPFNKPPQLASNGSRARMFPSLARLEDRPRDGQRPSQSIQRTRYLKHLSPTNISCRVMRSPKRKSTFLSMTFGVISATPKAVLSALTSLPVIFIKSRANYFSYRRKNLTFKANPSERMLKQHAAPPGQPANVGTIWVEFSPEPNIGIKHMRTFAHTIVTENYHTGIFVCQHNPTAAAMKIVPTVLPSIIEVFEEADLLVNITKHELVPSHHLLSREEKKRLLERYRLKETQLPRIQSADPVARYMGLKRGMVVKIVRKSETSGRYASYRLCM